MGIRTISIGSSSSGNSYIIQAGGSNILLDAGLTAKRIISALEQNNISPDDVDAVLVTHEHVDHVRSVRAIGRKCPRALFYASRGTVESAACFAYIPEERIRIIHAGDSMALGRTAEDSCDAISSDSEYCHNVTISAFNLSHDASEPTGFSISCGSDKLSVVTDTGIITDEIFDAVRDSTMLVFEANHDENLLMFGEYPYPVKMRIKGDHGHLSNSYAGEVLARILEYRQEEMPSPLHIMLAHLSFHNNAPLYARTTIESILEEKGYASDVDYTLTIAAKDEPTTFKL